MIMLYLYCKIGFGWGKQHFQKQNVIVCPEAWMLTIKKHNSRRAVQQWTTEETCSEDAPIAGVEFHPITVEHFSI